MPSTHFIGMVNHLREYPPGDFPTQRLIADLIHTVEVFMCGFQDKGGTAKPRKLEEIAPWLALPSGEKKRKRMSPDDPHRKAMMAVALQHGN